MRLPNARPLTVAPTFVAARMLPKSLSSLIRFAVSLRSASANSSQKVADLDALTAVRTRAVHAGVDLESTRTNEGGNAATRVLIVMVRRPVRDDHAHSIHRLALGVEVLNKRLKLKRHRGRKTHGMVHLLLVERDGVTSCVHGFQQAGDLCAEVPVLRAFPRVGLDDGRGLDLPCGRNASVREERLLRAEYATRKDGILRRAANLAITVHTGSAVL